MLLVRLVTGLPVRGRSAAAGSDGVRCSAPRGHAENPPGNPAAVFLTWRCPSS